MNIRKFFEKKWLADIYDVQKIEDIFNSDKKLKNSLKTKVRITRLLYFMISSFIWIVLTVTAQIIVLNFTWVSIFSYTLWLTILIIIVIIFCASGGILLYSAIVLLFEQNADVLAHTFWWKSTDSNLELAVKLYNQTNREEIISDNKKNSFILEKDGLIIKLFKSVDEVYYVEEEEEKSTYQKHITFNIKHSKSDDIFKDGENIELKLYHDKILNDFQEKTGLYYSVSWDET